MESFAWVLWILLGAVLIVAEIFTLGFVLFWFGVGALAAALGGYLGLNIYLQFLIFSVVSISLTAASRTIFSHRLALGEGPDLKTGVETLPGKIGTVTIASQGAMNEGEVKVYGSIWKAFPEDGETPLVQGEKVAVVRIEGSTLYVQNSEKQLAGWRDES
jgi:membrane protein implicated in regulation of membrane protease activity